jgi:hypothetical protein
MTTVKITNNTHNEISYGVGTYWLINSKLYILAASNTEHVALIALDCGLRWSKPVKVSDMCNLTPGEWSLLLGNMTSPTIAAVNKVTITIE